MQLLNSTPFEVLQLPLIDESGRETLTIVIKATYRIADNTTLVLADEQLPVNVTGEHYGEPESTSYRYEPEVAPIKPSTDIVLIGHAYPANDGDTEVDVGFRIGEIQKIVRVFGERAWVKSFGLDKITPPEALAPTPLTYENAFGGFDTSAPDAKASAVEMRNPVGTGYRSKKHGKFVEGRELPRIEDPAKLISDSNDAPAPAGFGFVGPHWQPRSALAGTFDAKWMHARMPLLPEDFDRRYFNAAHPDLIAKEYLTGGESVVVVNASKRGRLEFDLPRVAPPSVSVEFAQRDAEVVATNLDTVIINTDDDLVLLLWRGMLEIHGQLHDIKSVTVAGELVAA